ncbi:MAG: hypothetical protein K2M46_08070 [Lachnospiraceae bacterium]|nr:hypothetical protein [Lachnospiraceae bacterium]
MSPSKESISPKRLEKVISIADIFKAKIMDVCSEALVIELTGNLDKVDALIKLLEPYGILELARIRNRWRGNPQVV